MAHDKDQRMNNVQQIVGIVSKATALKAKLTAQVHCPKTFVCKLLPTSPFAIAKSQKREMQSLLISETIWMKHLQQCDDLNDCFNGNGHVDKTKISSTFCLAHPGLGLIIMSWMFHGCFRNGHSNVNIWWPKIGSLWLFVVNHRLNFKPSTGLTALLGYPIYVPGFHDVLLVGSRFFSESSYDFTVQKSHTNFQNVCQSLISYYLCRETKSFYFNTRSTADAFPFFRRRSYALTGKGHLRINNDLSITLRKFHCATSLGACEQKWYNNCTSCTGSLVP